MSYILDALQRREAQENPEAAAALIISHHKDQRTRLVGLLVVMALVLNAGVLWWLLVPESSRAQRSDAVATTPSANQDSPVIAMPPPVSPPIPAAPQSSTPALRRTSLGSMPNDARARFPGLAFSSHIYANDATLRAVVANGQRLTEGDAIQGVSVEQITETGVLVQFENYLVEIPVIAQWE